MKSLNHKQIAHSERKIRRDNLSRLRTFSLFVFGFIILVSASFLVANPTEANAKDIAKVVAGGGTSYALIMAANIEDVDNKFRAGKQTKYRLWFVTADQVDDTAAFPAKVDGKRGTLVLKAGEYWHYIKSVMDSPEPGSTAEAGDVGSTVKNSLPFIIGGITAQIRHFLENGVGNYYYVIWENCVTGEKYIGGTECKPLKLVSFEGGMKKDFTGFNVSFENEGSEMFCEYNGTIPTVAPTVVAADAVTIPLSVAEQYQLTTGGAAAANITGFTATTDADIGRIVEILGSGGAHPSTIDDDDDFTLENGATWTANAGSKLLVEIYKDAGATYRYIEVRGSRV
ncbi:MAG: hypothetical protein JEY96_01575 [Bacteroidales bacterium]|nr:hypothetical protein [Bacteroidales bacterium]